MELHSIQRTEQFLCDALIASPLIPLGVNVLRLADVLDNEGVVQNTNNIVIRYTGATNNVTNQIPLVYERRMTFELNFSCQNYLTSSGHDFATQLLSGAFKTLTGTVPSGAGFEVFEPFVCLNDQFTGLTDESQFTYTQVWVVGIQESLPYVALDPCVQRGNCRQIMPGLHVETRLPIAGVVDPETGSIYVPAYSCDKEPPEDYNACLGVRWSDEVQQSGNWVFICDPDCVFIEDPLNEPIYLLSNNSFTEDGKLVVTIWDAETRTPIREVFYCDTGKKLARYAIELWRNTINRTGGVSPNAVLDSTWTSGLNFGEFAVVKGGYAFLYSDPLTPEGKVVSLDGGSLVGILPDIFVQTPNGRFFYVGQSPHGKGWMLEDTFEYASINSLWKLGCPPCVGNPGPAPLC